MKKLTKILAVFTALLVCLPMTNAVAEQANVQQEQQMLNAKQQSLALIGKYTSQGDQVNLAKVLNQTFDGNALTLNETKDALYQLYAYLGFPKAINALGTLQNVVNERESKGLKTEIGRKPTALPADFDSLKAGKKVQTELVGAEVKGGVFDFAPEINRYLQAHLFGDVFASDLLNWQERKVLTLGALGADPLLAPQYNGHKNIGKHNGLTDEQIVEIENLLK